MKFPCKYLKKTKQKQSESAKICVSMYRTVIYCRVVAGCWKLSVKIFTDKFLSIKKGKTCFKQPTAATADNKITMLPTDGVV